MSNFWRDCGYLLLERDNDGQLIVTDDYLRMAMTPEGLLRTKPQNLLMNLPLAVRA